MKDSIVIIGSGIAAISAIKAIREVDNKVDIHMFSDENFYPYNRIGLTKRLFGNLEEKDLLIQKKEWYEENNINLHLNRKVTGINIDNSEILLSNEERFKFSKLLFANGASNFKPPIAGIDRNNVHSIRHLDDAWDIRKSADSNSIFVNIGGGILSLEAAWELTKQKKKVIIVEVLSRLMPRQLDERASEILLDKIRNYDIDVFLGTEIEEIYGRSSAEKVITKDGIELKCDVIIYSAGIRPNIAILKNSTIDINRGILVDECMRTNMENIYAAGDVAEYEGKVIGLWNIAIEQGKVAGYNVVGRNTTYRDTIPVTTLNAFDLSLFSMGDISEDKCSISLVDDNSSANIYKRIFIKDNKIVGAIVVGDAKKSLILKKAIEKELPLNDFKVSNISIDDLLSKLKV